jgi:hypothetical protein
MWSLDPHNDGEVARVVSLMVDPLVLDVPHVRGQWAINSTTVS